ncbi:MAG: histidinol-phosphatase [Bacteroidetes bacterium]|jgi:histidinol-phosphatase (PHP family)|nr:histidinol-phosphatase [Bacteroidota bacterium]
MIYRTDYHIHTTFSDGKADPEDYVDAALKAGINEIGFSEHLSLVKDRPDWCMEPSQIMTYINKIASLKERTSDIKIRTGLEVDYIPGAEKETELFLRDMDLDYRIGSVHYLDQKTVDMNPGFYKGKDIDLLYKGYFETVMTAVSSGLFDIIGHCDLIRIFGHKPSFSPEYLYRELAVCLKDNDIVFELNTNGRNKPLGDFYPDRQYLRLFSEAGVPVCVNSDAHLPDRVGQYFDEAYTLLKKSGFNEMAVFSSRKRDIIPF